MFLKYNFKKGPSVKIRKATKDDSNLILGFIKSLAEFEKLSHEVVATEEKISETIFDNKNAEVVIAETETDGPVGFALYFKTYSTFLAQPGMYLEDLFVLPEQRGKGYGTALLKHLAGIARENHFGRFEWSVLNWNQKAIDVYEKIGASPQKEWTAYRLNSSSLKTFAGK